MPTGVRIDVSLEQIESLTNNLDGQIPAIAQAGWRTIQPEMAV